MAFQMLRGSFPIRGGLIGLALAVLVIFEFVSSAAAATSSVAGTVSTSRSRSARSTFTIPTKVKKIRPADNVTVRLGSYTFEIRGSTFKRQANKRILQFKAKKGTLGLVSATHNSDARIFTFVLQGVPLVDQRFPLSLAVGVRTAQSCDLLGGQGKSSVSKKALSLRRLGKCPNRGEVLTSSVGLLTVGATSEVIFQLGATGPVSSLALYTGDASGATAAKICDMSDAGDASNGDSIPGDYIYACKASITPTAIGKRFFVARGKRGGSITFPGLALSSIKVLSESDASAALSTQSAALDLWNSVSANLGATGAARLETIQKILGLPGVRSAGLTPNGIDFALTMESGLDVILVLNTKPVNSSFASGAMRSGAPFATRKRSDSSRYASLPQAATGTLKIFLYDPGYFPNTENETLTAFAAAADPGEVQITAIQGDAAKNVRSLDVVTGFDFAVFTTHGSIDSNGRVGFVMPLRDAAQIAEYLPLLQSGKLVLSGTQNIGPGISHESVLVMPDYFLGLPGSFQNTTVIGSSCYSAANGSMASALLSKGAAAYLGYDEVVFSDFAADKASEFFCSTLVEKKNVGEAYQALSPKTDDTPYTKSEGDTPTFATIKFVGNASTVLTESAEFDEFKILLNPPRTLLFYGESTTVEISIGGQNLPPCLKFRVRNNSSDLVSIARQPTGGPSVPLGEDLFSDGNIKYTAGTSAGVADVSTYVVREKDEAIVGQRKPEIEVLCAQPTVGTLVPATGTVQAGQEASFNLNQLNAPGCDLRIGFSALNLNQSGDVVTNEASCGVPLNAGLVALPDLEGWSIPVSELPIRISTVGCVNTRKISLLYYEYIASQIAPQFEDSRFLTEVPLHTEVLVSTDNTIQSGSFETKFILYDRDVPPFGILNRFYVTTLPLVTPIAPGQTSRYCLKVDTHGIPGPDNQAALLTFPPDHEYFVISENICDRLAQSPGFYTPTPEECAGFLGDKEALFAFGPGSNFGFFSSVLAGETPGCTDLCTPAEALAYYAPLRSWTFTARRLSGTQLNCSSP